MQMPIGMEASFQGVVDLMTMKAIYWDDELGREPREAEIPADLKTEAEERRHTMVERIAELDDDLTVKYLEGEEISNEELKDALRQAVIDKQGYTGFLWKFACAIKVFNWFWMQ